MNKVVGLIPARSGSERLKRKNYLKFGDFSIVENTIVKTIESDSFDKIYLSSDDETLSELAYKYDINFHLRDIQDANSSATSEQVVAKFLEDILCEYVVWVNTASPLQTVNDIRNSVKEFLDSNKSCFVAVNKIYTHCSYNTEPINFSFNESFAKTQDLIPINKYIYSTMGWRSKTFKDNMNKGHKGLFSRDILEVEVSSYAGFLLKTIDDYNLINLVNSHIGELNA